LCFFSHMCCILSHTFFPLFLYACFDFQRYPTDRAYFIAKEILMTERTYKKDLEVISLVCSISFYIFREVQICLCRLCLNVKIVQGYNAFKVHSSQSASNYLITYWEVCY
jgi:hypothetical protein